MNLELIHSRKKYVLQATEERGVYEVSVEGKIIQVRVTRIEGGKLRVRIGSRERIVELLEESSATLRLNIDGEGFTFERQQILSTGGEPAKAAAVSDKDTLLSPLPGTVTSVEVHEGQRVRPGTALLVIEAMKMESVIKSDRDGKIMAILVKKGVSVRKGQPLLRFHRGG